ncbi:MAG: 4Fe-4S cluster-binding domain-containing protein, partial [Lachnospiraceae bacterium]|nr:4Fe-4S cluster-binding domain-containing protein [Lachnospiraceae bacterium]
MLICGLNKTTLLDYPGKVAATVFTGGCNFRCPFCHNKDLILHPAEYASYTDEDVFAHLKKRAGRCNAAR